MKHTKTEIIPARTEVKFTHITCDICGTQSARQYDWINEPYSECFTKIEKMQGENYPEGRWGTKTVVDICPKCFNEKLLPFLLSLGVIPLEEEYNE